MSASLAHRRVLLCTEQGDVTGEAPLLDAHQGEGMLHRAFSVFVFRKQGTELLIQKRSAGKLLWPGIWANTCCSHPNIGEAPTAAGERRLQEECGFSVPLQEFSSFVYRAEDEGRGIEFEYDTILLGQADENLILQPNPEEIDDIKWVAIEKLQHDMQERPLEFAPWFHLALKMILARTQYPS